MPKLCAVIVAVVISTYAFGSPYLDSSVARTEDATVDNLHPVCEVPQEHFLTVYKLRIHYVESGAGPTVVMVHGNAGGVEDFSLGAFGLLCSKHRVLAIDRPGHGKSQRTGKHRFTLEYQAELLHQTLSQLEVSQPILVGHSWGASLVLAYTLKYQTEVSAAVLLAPAAYADKGSYRFLRLATKAGFL